MPIYERFNGGQVAERVRPVPGSKDAERYAALAEDPASGWKCAEPDAAPEPPARPAKSASKAVWVEYAVSQGVSEGDAEKATRDELAALFADGGDS